MDENALRQSIPDSVLPYPKGAYNRSKYLFWKLIYPFHNGGRDFLLSIGVIHHEGRQNYPIGKIAPDKDIKDFLNYLEECGYGNQFVALRDDEEVISVRKVIDFEHQYHLRIFRDGEVRGHYEYTPESHPWRHMKKVGQMPYHEDELKFLEGWVDPVYSRLSQNFSDERSSVTRIIGRRPFGVGKSKV